MEADLPAILGRRKPDYAFFLDDAALNLALDAGRSDPALWHHPAVVADAKSWDLPLNQPVVINNAREYPPKQIEWYLDRSHVPYGILTNGKLWRLVPRNHAQHQRRFQTYLECDLENMLEEWRAARNLAQQSALFEEFVQFYLFFGPRAYARTERLKPLIERALEGSNEYRLLPAPPRQSKQTPRKNSRRGKN